MYLDLDHKLEYKLYSEENYKADKYVSTLINEFSFFKTTYIRTFFKDIDSLQKEDNSCSAYISKTYQELCDVLHGRYLTLTKKSNLKIEYDHNLFKKFETQLRYTLSAISMMYVLRFNDFSNVEINNLIKYSSAINI